MDPTITVAIGDETHEVPASAVTLPEGAGFYGGDFGAPSGYADAETIRRRLDAHGKAVIKNGGYLTKEEAYSPDALKAHFTGRGVDFSEDGLPIGKLDPERVNAMKAQWKATEVDPLAAERDALSGTVADLRSQVVAATVKTALMPELSPDAFKPAVPGVPSPVESIISAGVRHDDDGRPFFQIGEGVPEYDVPKGILDYVTTHARSMLADKTQGGAGSGGQFRGGGGNKQMARADFEKLAPAAAADFIKKGGTIV
ncbi:MAG: hypothetical protein AAF791_02830 [Bacteroidota bacterium]